MTASKQHFEMVARVLRRQDYNTVESANPVDQQHAMLRDIAVAFAAEFAASNPRFDRARFLKACGLSQS